MSRDNNFVIRNLIFSGSSYEGRTKTKRCTALCTVQSLLLENNVEIYALCIVR